MNGATLLPAGPLAELLRRRYDSQHAAARAVGVDHTSISLWAAGRRRVGFWTADRVCVAAGVHPVEVWGDLWLGAAMA